MARGGDSEVVQALPIDISWGRDDSVEPSTPVSGHWLGMQLPLRTRVRLPEPKIHQFMWRSSLCAVGVIHPPCPPPGNARGRSLDKPRERLLRGGRKGFLLPLFLLHIVDVAKAVFRCLPWGTGHAQSIFSPKLRLPEQEGR